MPDQSGFFSNRYAYEPFDVNDGAAETVGGVLGKTAGQVIGGEFGHVGTQVGGHIGKNAGEQLGSYIDNADAIYKNAQTFLTELNDWRSWTNLVPSWGADMGAFGR